MPLHRCQLILGGHPVDYVLRICPSREDVMETAILFAAVAALILLVVTSMRFGVDSREGFASNEREFAAPRIV